jgi:glycosyltransferase involved in cell wall biosynthesis
MSNKNPIRVLQVTGNTGRGGIETWMMHILRQINCNGERVRMDFLVHTATPGIYDDEIRNRGGEVIYCPRPSNPWIYARNFKRILREYGPYDVVHSHVHYYSGYVLRLAEKGGVPIRIAHSHFDKSPIEDKSGFYRHLYLSLMKRWITRYATVGLGVSRLAAIDLFGANWQSNPRWHVLSLGLDLSPFKKSYDSIEVRSEFGIPNDAFVVGHVGRFAEQKNHAFMVHIIAEIIKRDQDAHFLFVGEGHLRQAIERQIIKAGLADRVTFTGLRNDVPRLMMAAIDVFLFPSLYEGVGLVIIEAQAAGVPCIISDVIPEEADVVKPLVHRVSLSQSASLWAEAVLEKRTTKTRTNQLKSLSIIAKSSFNSILSAEKLLQLYSNKSA